MLHYLQVDESDVFATIFNDAMTNDTTAELWEVMATVYSVLVPSTTF